MAAVRFTSGLRHPAKQARGDDYMPVRGGRQRRTAATDAEDGRYWARTSDPQLVELVLSQLS